MIDTVILYILMLSVIGLDPDSRSQQLEKANVLAPIISQRFLSVWMEYGVLFRLLGVWANMLAPVISQRFLSVWMEYGVLFRLLGVWWTSYSFYLIHSVFNGDNPVYVILLNKLSIGWYSHIYRLIFFKHGMMIKTIKLYIVIVPLDDLTFIQGHWCKSNKKKKKTLTIWSPFSGKFWCHLNGNSVCGHNLLFCGSSC